MTTIPADSAYIVSQLSTDDPINARVLEGGLGIVVSDSGPGSAVNIAATKIIGSIESLESVGFLIREAGDVADTRTLTSDGSISISAADGSTGNPVFGVVPGTSVQKTNWELSGNLVGTRDTANFIPGEGMGITMNDNGSTIDIVFSGGGGGIINPYDGTLNVQNLVTGFTPGPQVDLNEFISETLNSISSLESDVQYISSTPGLTTISSDVFANDISCDNIRNQAGSTFIDMTDANDIVVNASLFTALAMETATLNLQQQSNEPALSAGNSILYANENDGRLYKRNPNGSNVFLLEQGDNVSGFNYYLDTTTANPIGSLITSPNTGAQTNLTLISPTIASNVLIGSFTTQSVLSDSIQGGQWDLHLYANASDNINMKYYFNVYTVSPLNVETIIANGSSVQTLIGTTVQDYIRSVYVPNTTLPDLTYNIRIKVFANYGIAAGSINTFYRGSTNSNLTTTISAVIPNLMATNDLIPSTTDIYDVGKSGFKYRDGYFSRNLTSFKTKNDITALIPQVGIPTPTSGDTWVYAASDGALHYGTASNDYTVATTSSLGSYLPLAGGTMSGNINLGTKDLLSVGTISATQYIDVTTPGVIIKYDGSITGDMRCGLNAGALATGARNITIGQNAFTSANAGFGSISIGSNAARFSKGDRTLAIGDNALTGDPLLFSLGDNNVSVGPETLFDLSTGSGNVVFGYSSGAGLKTGSNNLLLGGVNNCGASGSNNIQLGNTVSNNNFSSSIGIGNGTVITQSNQCVISGVNQIIPQTSATLGSATKNFSNIHLSGDIVGTTKTSSANNLVTSSASTSVDSNIVIFSSTTGKIIKESGVGISSVAQAAISTAKTSESVGPVGYRDPWALSSSVAFSTSVGATYMTNVSRWITGDNGGGTKYSNDGGATWISSTGSVAASDAAYAFSPTLGIATIKTTASNITQTTSDGITWGSGVNSGAPGAGNIIWANGLFVSGTQTAGSYIQTSPDGLNWTVRPAARPVRSVMWTGTKFVSVGTSGVMSSLDGITWVNEATTTPMLWGVYSPELKCIIGISSSASTSVFKSTDNGATFTTLTNIIPISTAFRAGIWVPELSKFYFSTWSGNVPYFFEFDGTNPMTGGALTQQGVPNNTNEVYTMGYTHSLGRFFIGGNFNNGLFYSTKSSNLAVSGNEYLQGNLVVGGNSNVSGDFTCVQPYATWYASASTPIAFTANTIRLVPLVNTSGLLSGFTNNTTTGVLTYTGTKTRLVKVCYDISVSYNIPSTDLATHFITKNGSLALGTSQSRIVKQIDSSSDVLVQNISVSDIISVSTNDTIGLASRTFGASTGTYSFVNVNVVSLLT